MSRREEKDRERLRAFGTRLRQLREEAGLSQEKLAEAAGVHRAEVGFVERAEREVGITLAWRLADGLGQPLSALTTDAAPQA